MMGQKFASECLIWCLFLIRFKLCSSDGFQFNYGDNDATTTSSNRSNYLTLNGKTSNRVISNLTNQLPFKILDFRSQRYRNKFFNKPSIGVLNVHPTQIQHKGNNTQTFSWTRLVGGKNHIPSTTPYLPNFFTPLTDNLETVLEPPPTQLDNPQLVGDLSMSNSGVGVTRKLETSTTQGKRQFASTEYKVNVGPHSNPASSDYNVNPELSIPPIAEPPNESNLSDIMLRVWSWVDGEGLQLQFQHEIPNSILGGYNKLPQGPIINIDQIPFPLMKDIASTLNLTSSVIKRHSGPGSVGAFHQWQQLPIGTGSFSNYPATINTDHGFHWQKLPSQSPAVVTTAASLGVRRPSPVALNYILWSSTPRPISAQIQRLPSSLPLPMPTVPVLSGSTVLPDQDFMTKVNSMAHLLSQNKKESNSQPQSPDLNTLGMSPSQFWNDFVPLYLNYLNSGAGGNQNSQRRPINELNGPMRRRVPPGLPTRNPPIQSVTASDDYSFYPTAESRPLTGYNDGSKTGLFKAIKKVIKKKKKKKKKKRRRTNSLESQALQFLSPQNFNFNYSFAFNLMDFVQKFFYKLLLLKAAPLLILGFLALVPFVALFIPKIIAGLKWGDLILHALKLKKQHHHYHPPTKQNHHHYYTSSGWSPVEYHNHGRRDDPKRNLDWTYPAPGIGSLVQSTYGDPVIPRGRQGTSANEDTAGILSEVLALYDTELDTEHNRKVMEILMESKNATLQKLLESWELVSQHEGMDVRNPLSSGRLSGKINRRKRRR